MNEYPQLQNAPIVEALIDIQVQLPASKTVGSLCVIHEKVKSDFPKEKEGL